MEMSSNETIKQAVIAGLGVALISAHTVAAEVADGRIAVLDVERLPIVRRWYVVRRADHRLLPPAAALWRFLVEEGAAHLPEMPLPPVPVHTGRVASTPSTSSKRRSKP